MSETKHTPGPWTSRPNSCCVTLPDGGVLVALTYGFCRGSGEDEDCATARLIAAAPELLETLIYVRDNAASDSPEMWQRVEEIIAKATGADHA